MRVLLDECVPRALRRDIPGHEVKTVAEAGWAGVKNGELLRLKHDPEKWTPVFRKDHAQTKCQSRVLIKSERIRL